MDTAAVTVNQAPASAPAPDLAALKARQRAAWSSGDYAVIGTRLQIVGEDLCEALDLRGGEKVLDVAAGNGNASLAAARRWCEVTATDYVSALLEHARARAEADGLELAFQEADAEDLPFDDGSFDVVMSTFGVMFTPAQERAAREMLRVCRCGGRIGLANWTPEGFIGQLFKTLGKYIPPAAGTRSPALWGTRARIEELFGEQATDITATPRHYVFRFRSPQHWIDVFRTYYGPVLKAFAALEPHARVAFEADLRQLIARFNRANDGTAAIAGEYLEIVIVRS